MKKMKLRHITFTGIDARTDMKELKAIQQQYPIAEFGVLTGTIPIAHALIVLARRPPSSM